MSEKEALEIVLSAANRVPLVMDQNAILRQAIQVLTAAVERLTAPKTDGA